MVTALLIIAGAAVGVELTMEPGKYRSLAWVLLGFFAFRVMLGYGNIKRRKKTKVGERAT